MASKCQVLPLLEAWGCAASLMYRLFSRCHVDRLLPISGKICTGASHNFLRSLCMAWHISFAQDMVGMLPCDAAVAS